MIICQPQEDELITSHLSRLAHLNGMGFDRFITRLTSSGRENKKHSSQSLEIYQRISALVGLSPEEYLRRHTMAPIERFAANSEEQVHNFELPTPHRQRDTLLRLNSPAYFCRECASSEVEDRGFSTWKRIHQITGVEWCLIHGIQLHSVKGLDAILMQPHMIILERSFACHADESWKENSSVIKYASFCLSMLKNPSRFHRKEISKIMLPHHSEKGLITKPNSVGKRLSDLVKEHYPISWLAKHYPSIATKAPNNHCATIDTIVSSVKGIPGESYAISLSLLFNDHTDAIAHIKSPLIKPRLLRLTTSQMINLWLNNMGNVSAIAESLGRSYAHTALVFRSRGFPSCHLATNEQVEEVAHFFRTSPTDTIDLWLFANKQRFDQLEKNKISTISRAESLPTKTR